MHLHIAPAAGCLSLLWSTVQFGHYGGDDPTRYEAENQMSHESDRRTFLDWLDQPESFPTRLAKEESSTIEELLTCDDILPGLYCSQLGLPQGSSYAQAARDFARQRRLRSAAATPWQASTF